MSFWLKNLKPGRAEIRFPKFQLRKSCSLKSLLRSSGVSSVFSNSADSSGVSPRTVRLVKALQEVSLEVDETMSEDRGISDVTLDFSVPPRVTFDRPFLLIIYDELTRFILLMGKITNPKDI
ncbi:protein Z-dependent protease inhibitor-like [Myripristis murdjan]|uniref:protein Z-dependent protease inhibitor-like n=1 Tax=Myripristis murdjan TaxID=586833 RepID=UPI00117619A1|nr:protein Z-dependent protease inhibitor-like [Myripristis murdjan]